MLTAAFLLLDDGSPKGKMCVGEICEWKQRIRLLFYFIWFTSSCTCLNFLFKNKFYYFNPRCCRSLLKKKSFQLKWYVPCKTLLNFCTLARGPPHCSNLSSLAGDYKTQPIEPETSSWLNKRNFAFLYFTFTTSARSGLMMMMMMINKARTTCSYL